VRRIKGVESSGEMEKIGKEKNLQKRREKIEEKKRE
jgi:hypothetical protein